LSKTEAAISGIARGEEESALIRYRDGRFTVFTQQDGAPPGWTKDLFTDSAGRLWLTDSTAGAWRLDDTNADRLQFVKYTTAEGLSSNDALCVTEDRFGRIYTGTGRGLNRLNPASGQIESFTTADGLPSAYVEIAYRDRAGALWFSTINGLARFTPEPERVRKPPIVLITGLRVAGVAQKISFMGETEAPHLNLDSSQKQISVDFIGLGATLGEKLKYEYRFGNSDWTSTTERTVNFDNLSSGDYQFEVRVDTADRIYSQKPSTVSFKIAAPFWQNPLFVISLFALAAAAIYFFYRFRLQRLLEMERIGTRIAGDLHDDIGAGLSRIAILSEVASHQANQHGDTQVTEKLSVIAGVSRELVDSMSNIVWVINPNRDQLSDLTQRMRRFASDVLTARDIEFNFSVPEADHDLQIGADVRRHLLLIFKECVNNIVRHSKCTKADIELKIEGKWLGLRISDDGNGFDTLQTSGGNGLANMRLRAEKIGGKIRIVTNAESGTTVSLTTTLAADFKRRNGHLR